MTFYTFEVVTPPPPPNAFARECREKDGSIMIRVTLGQEFRIVWDVTVNKDMADEFDRLVTEPVAETGFDGDGSQKQRGQHYWWITSNAHQNKASLSFHTDVNGTPNVLTVQLTSKFLKELISGLLAFVRVEGDGDVPVSSDSK